MIVDQEEGQSRLLSIGDSGVEETLFASIEDAADELVTRQPDLILVTPRAREHGGEQLVSQLNRLGRVAGIKQTEYRTQ